MIERLEDIYKRRGLEGTFLRLPEPFSNYSVDIVEGECYDHEAGRWLYHKNCNGYDYFGWDIKNKSYGRQVSSFICYAITGRVMNVGERVLHDDGDLSNNDYRNLSLKTPLYRHVKTEYKEKPAPKFRNALLSDIYKALGLQETILPLPEPWTGYSIDVETGSVYYHRKQMWLHPKYKPKWRQYYYRLFKDGTGKRFERNVQRLIAFAILGKQLPHRVIVDFVDRESKTLNYKNLYLTSKLNTIVDNPGDWWKVLVEKDRISNSSYTIYFD